MRRFVNLHRQMIKGISMSSLWVGLLVLILLSSTCCIPPCQAKEGDRGLPTNRQLISTKPKGVYKHDETVLYQEGGFLCAEDECYESTNLHDILAEQIQLSQLPHTCRNLRSNCQTRANQGDCTNATLTEYMHSYCPKSCQTCRNRTRLLVVDDRYGESDRIITTKGKVTRLRPQRNRTISGKMATSLNIYGEAINSETYHGWTSPSAEPRRPPHPMSMSILNITSTKLKDDDDSDEDIIDGYGSDLGVPQLLFEGALRNAILYRIQEAQDYVNNVIMVDNRYRIVRNKCRHASPYCAAWAALGHCDSGQYYSYMSAQCGPVCETCTDQHAEAKCPIDYNVKHAWYPGDLNRMFERILQEQRSGGRSNVTTLSSPATTRGPWVLQIDDFVSSEEADRLIELGAREGYSRSEDVGDEDEDGEAGGVVSSGRTSTNAWCEPDTCEYEDVPQQVVSRIETLSGIHRNYSEVFQLLRYEPGQFYESHHDYIEIDRERIQGVRILTVFMYLNDVEEGGGTNFPELDLTIMPKKGRAVLWPSVLDDFPHDKDIRTTHQALPVIKGIKYGANAWIHQRHTRVATYELFC